MTATFTFVVIIIVIALIFDYSNGFHDAANSIATVVSTRVLSPGVAVVWAAFFNFIAFLIYGTRVAKAIGDGVNMSLIAPDDRLYVLLAALIGAVLWNIATWYLGLPTSSSHALLGGYAGAGIAAHWGVAGLLKTEVWTKVIIFIVLSPLIGLVLGLALMVAVYWIFRRWSPHRVDRLFRTGQLFSAAAFSLGHGGNDAQKTMGIITAGLAAGRLRAYRPDVSTTHTITGAIVGVGATRRLSAVKWGVAGRIVWAWILTIPLAGLVAAVSFLVCRAVAGLL